MNPNSETQEPEILQPEETVEEIDADSYESVDDFIKELEAKEKDLHITADYQIEVTESDVDDTNPPAFIQEELAAVKKPTAAAVNARTEGMKTRVFELEKEVESLNNKLTALRMERNDVEQKSDRRRKDFESYKYRMDRERRGAFINQIGNLATQLLPVLDNLDRALDSIKDVPEKKRDEFKQFFNGIELVNQQVNEVLSDMGVQPITTTGELFDPNFHEAVSTDENSDLPPNSISAEMLRGYKIGNLVIRHSMVRVTPSQTAAKTDKKDVKEETPETSIEVSEETPADAGQA
ncbi:MAG: nucleotide exchange factor GrpE [Pyrinomonadaceae bacterium]